MIKFVAFYPHVFFHDPRMYQLTTQEQQQWLFLLAKMMQTEAKIPENYKLIAKLLDCKVKAAENLIIKLKRLGLLIASDTGEKIFMLTSHKLTTEYIKAKHFTEMAVNRAKKGAGARWPDDATSNASSNAD